MSKVETLKINKDIGTQSKVKFNKEETAQLETNVLTEKSDRMEYNKMSSLLFYFPKQIAGGIYPFSTATTSVVIISVILFVLIRYNFKCDINPELILKNAEEKILSSLRIPYNARYIDVGQITAGKNTSKIWTVSLNENSKEIPLVLLHGFGAGVGFWALNFVSFSQTRPVHAIDLLGFARSSRPQFSSVPEEAEKELIRSIEAWRVEMKLEKMILLGHSFGGYLSTSYSLSHPDPVVHLILADPWGFQETPVDVLSTPKLARVPWLVKRLINAGVPFNPLAALRFAGNTLGPKILQTARGDIIAKFKNVVENDTMAQYIYHCNSQSPSAESVFYNLQANFAWAKFPMRHRIQNLETNIPMTLIYGSHSWVDHYPVQNIKEQRPSSYVVGKILMGAGHHVYADNAHEFNNIVNQACKHMKRS